MKTFDEWSEAEDWAGEVNRYLEPMGTYTGEERILRSWNNNTTQVQLWSRYASVLAIGERTHEVVCAIKEHIVVTSDYHPHGDYDIYHADDLEEAMKHFDYEVSRLKTNA